MLTPIDVFLSYASADDAHARELEKHLATLTREGLIRTWSHRRIGAGEDWRSAVDRNIEGARLILLLISPDYWDSDYCHDVEMERALERHRLGQARVIPLVIRSVLWRGSKFDRMGLAPLPQGGKAVSDPIWGGSDRAWKHVATALRSIVRELQGAPAATPESTAQSYSSPAAYTAIPPGPSSVAGRTAATSLDAPRIGWVWGLAGIGALCLAVLLAFVVVAVVNAPPRTTNGSAPPYARPAPVPAPRPALGSTTCGAPCCGGIECSGTAQDMRGSMCETRAGHCARCTSGRTCVQGACGEDLDRSARWLLRLADVTLSGSTPNTVVCVRRTAAPTSTPTCTRLADAADSPRAPPGAAARTRLLIETDDLLTGHGIDVGVWNEQTSIAEGHAEVGSSLLRSALCIGVGLHVAGGGVRSYLDDP